MRHAAAAYALFDMDGLLLDTEIVYTRVTQGIVARFGKTFDWSVKANMIGRPSRDSARYLVQALDLPISAEEYMEERNDLLKQAFRQTDPLPGAERLVRHLHQHGVPMALATSSFTDLFTIKREPHRHWFDLFDAIVTGDDPEIRAGKPSPDIFLVAARRIGAVPEQTLVFEDAPSGLEAGLAAGMRVIAVPDPNMDRGRYHNATLVLNNLEEFNPADFGLPPYPRD